MSKVIEVSSKAELDAALSKAPGQVAVSFVQDGCTPCAETKPHVESLAESCSSLTVVRVDLDKVQPTDLQAERYFDAVDGAPTTLIAKTGAAFIAGKVTEVDPEDPALRRRLKCALPTGPAK